ncbi:ABC transporter ATP-binding protein [Acidovorax cavernicola]|uniref:ABC transporter ATP-binding protein n=1 Tax=Acidovorax cavernicola TaxID=1675792 RepID=A0A9X8CY64_9BURK|nr:ABC transporter ATP-binding protein [Acidovorax cavernicola]RIX71438.1 ABC transporter ATP-binding protein [Acidovorax cavernicola]
MSATAMLGAAHLFLQRQGRVLLDDISLDLPQRGAVALVGPNGAGKSTLLQVLAGQLAPERGGVALQGRPLRALDVRARARHIGYMPQRFEPHWDVTLHDLVQMRLPDPAQAAQVLVQADLQPLAARRWSTLSGGERARGMLAAVLATDPPVLLADEPGAALDVQHRLALVQALARRGRERLVVVVMHDLDLAFECFDRVVVMHAGRVAMDGVPADLLHAPQLDEVFGVRFQRIAVAPHTLLRARSRPQEETT